MSAPKFRVSVYIERVVDDGVLEECEPLGETRTVIELHSEEHAKKFVNSLLETGKECRQIIEEASKKDANG